MSLKKLSSVPKKIAQAVLLVEAPHLVGDPVAALDAMLPLVVGGDRAVGTGELAAEGQDERTDGTALSHPIGRQRPRAERGVPARRLQEPVAEHRVGQFVQIAQQALDAGVDQFLGDAVLAAARIDQAGNAVERPAVARAKNAERIDSPRPRIDSTTSSRLSRTYSSPVTTTSALPGPQWIGAEKIIGLVDGVRTAGDDQRAVRGVDPPGVADHLHAPLGVHAHARDHEQVGDPAVEPHPRGPEIAVPLLQDDAGLVEPGIDHGRADRPHAGGHHSRVGEDERQHPRAMIEGAGDHRRQIVFLRANPQALAQARQFARFEQFVAARSAGKFHGEPLGGR